MNELAAPLRAESPITNQPVIVMLPPPGGTPSGVAPTGSYPVMMPMGTKLGAAQPMAIRPCEDGSNHVAGKSTSTTTTPPIIPAFQVVGGVVRILLPPNLSARKPVVKKKRKLPPRQQIVVPQQTLAQQQEEVRVKKMLTMEEIMQQYKTIVPRQSEQQNRFSNVLISLPAPSAVSTDSTNAPAALSRSSGTCYVPSTSTDVSTSSSMQTEQCSTAVNLCSTLPNTSTIKTQNTRLAAASSEGISVTSNMTSPAITPPALSTDMSVGLNCKSVRVSGTSGSQIVVLGVPDSTPSVVANNTSVQNSKCDLMTDIISIETESESRSVKLEPQSVCEQSVDAISSAIHNVSVESDSYQIKNVSVRVNEENTCKAPEDLVTEIPEEESHQFRRVTRSMARKRTKSAPLNEPIPTSNSSDSNITCNTVSNRTGSISSVELKSERSFNCEKIIVSKIDNTMTPNVSGSLSTPFTPITSPLGPNNILPTIPSSAGEHSMNIVTNKVSETSISVKSLRTLVESNEVVSERIIIPGEVPKVSSGEPNLRNSGVEDTCNISKGLEVPCVNLNKYGNCTVVPNVIDGTCVPSSNITPNVLGDMGAGDISSTGVIANTARAPLGIHSNNVTGLTHNIPLFATKVVSSTSKDTIVPISLSVVVNENISSVVNSVNCPTSSDSVNVSQGTNKLVSQYKPSQNVTMSNGSKMVASSSNFPQEVAPSCGVVSQSNRKAVITTTKSAVFSSKFPQEVATTNAPNSVVSEYNSSSKSMITNPASAQTSQSSVPQQIASDDSTIISCSSVRQFMVPNGAETIPSPSNFPQQVMVTDAPSPLISPVNVLQKPITNETSNEVLPTDLPRHVVNSNSANVIVSPSNFPHSFMIANSSTAVVPSTVFPQQSGITGDNSRMVSPSSLSHQVMIMNTPSAMVSPSNLSHQVMIMNSPRAVVSPSIVPQQIAISSQVNGNALHSNCSRKIAILRGSKRMVSSPNLSHEGSFRETPSPIVSSSNVIHEIPMAIVHNSISSLPNLPHQVSISKGANTFVSSSNVSEQNVSPKETNLDCTLLSGIKIKTEPEEAENDFILPDDEELCTPPLFDRVDVKCENDAFGKDASASDPVQLQDPLAVGPHESTSLACIASENCVKKENECVDVGNTQSVVKKVQQLDDGAIGKKEIPDVSSLKEFLSLNNVKTEREEGEKDCGAKAVNEEFSEPVFHLAGDTLIKIQVPKSSLELLSQNNYNVSPAADLGITSGALHTSTSGSLNENCDVRCQRSAENFSQSAFGMSSGPTHSIDNVHRITHRKSGESSDEEIDVEGLDDIDDTPKKSDDAYKTHGASEKSPFSSSVGRDCDFAMLTSQSIVVSNVKDRAEREVSCNLGSLVSIECGVMRCDASDGTSSVDDEKRSGNDSAVGVVHNVGNSEVGIDKRNANSCVDSLSCEDNACTKKISEHNVEGVSTQEKLMLESTPKDREVCSADLSQNLHDQMMEVDAFSERNEVLDANSGTDKITTKSGDVMKNNVTENSSKKQVSPSGSMKERSVKNYDIEKGLPKSLTNCFVVLRDIFSDVNHRHSSEQGNHLRRSLRSRKVVNYKEPNFPRIVYSSGELSHCNTLNRTHRNLNNETPHSSSQISNLHCNTIEENISNSSTVSLCKLKQQLQSKFAHRTLSIKSNLSENYFNEQGTNISKGTCQKSSNEEVFSNKHVNNKVCSTSVVESEIAQLENSSACDITLGENKSKQNKNSFNNESLCDVQGTMSSEDSCSDDSVRLHIDETVEKNDADPKNSPSGNKDSDDLCRGVEIEPISNSTSTSEMSRSVSQRPLFSGVENTPVGVLPSIETVSKECDLSLKLPESVSQKNIFPSVHNVAVTPVEKNVIESEKNTLLRENMEDTVKIADTVENPASNRASVLRQSLIEVIGRDFEEIEVPSQKLCSKLAGSKKRKRGIGTRKQRKKKNVSNSAGEVDLNLCNSDSDLTKTSDKFCVLGDVPNLTHRTEDLSKDSQCLAKGIDDKGLTNSSSVEGIVPSEDPPSVAVTKSLDSEENKEVEFSDTVLKCDRREQPFELHSVKEINDSCSETYCNSPVLPSDSVNSMGQVPVGENDSCETFGYACEENSSHSLNILSHCSVKSSDPKCVNYMPVVDSTDISVGMLPSIEEDSVFEKTTRSGFLCGSMKSDTPEILIKTEDLGDNENSSVPCYDTKNVLMDMVSTNEVESSILDNGSVSSSPAAKTTSTTTAASLLNSAVHSESSANSSDEVIVVDSHSSEKGNNVSFSRRPRIKRLRKNRVGAVLSDAVQSTVSCKWTDYDTAICNISPVSNKFAAVSSASVTSTFSEALSKDKTVPHIRQGNGRSANYTPPIYTIDSEDTVDGESEVHSNSVEPPSETNSQSSNKKECNYQSSKHFLGRFSPNANAVNSSKTTDCMAKYKIVSTIHDKINLKNSLSHGLSHVHLGKERFQRIRILPSDEAIGVCTLPVEYSQNKNTSDSSIVILPSGKNRSVMSTRSNSSFSACDSVCTNSLVNVTTASITSSKTANVFTTTTNTITTTRSNLGESSLGSSKERVHTAHEGFANLGAYAVTSLSTSDPLVSETFLKCSEEGSPIVCSVSKEMSNRPEACVIASAAANLPQVSKNFSVKIASNPIPVINSEESVVMTRSKETRSSKASLTSRYRKIVPKPYQNFVYVKVLEDREHGYIQIPIDSCSVEGMNIELPMKSPQLTETFKSTSGSLSSQAEGRNDVYSVGSKEKDNVNDTCVANSAVEVICISDTAADSRNVTRKSKSSKSSLYQRELAKLTTALASPSLELSSFISNYYLSRSSPMHKSAYQLQLAVLKESFQNDPESTSSKVDDIKKWPVPTEIRSWLSQDPSGPSCICPLGEPCTCGAKEIFHMKLEQRQTWEEKEEQRKRLKTQKTRWRRNRNRVLCEQCGVLTPRRNFYKHRHEHQHIHIAPPPVRYECKLCKKTYKHQKMYLQHMMVMHNVSADQIYRCSTCGKNFRNRKALSIHRNSHSTFEKFRNEVLSDVTNDEQQHVLAADSKDSEVLCLGDKGEDGRRKRRLEELHNHQTTRELRSNSGRSPIEERKGEEDLKGKEEVEGQGNKEKRWESNG